MTEIYLGLGSNIGDRTRTLVLGVALLMEKGVLLKKISSLYETPPYGYTDQPAFLNAVGLFEYSGSPEELLQLTSETETLLGRKREIRWGPRSIDIDILLFGERCMNKEKLTIPHYDMKNRSFVLVPLLEIDASLVDPVTGIKYADYLENLAEQVTLTKVIDSTGFIKMVEVLDVTEKMQHYKRD